MCYFSELAGNPKLAEIGLSQSMGSMEGKEVRFGIAQSALFTTVTTSFTTGTVNNMHDTLTPLGGMVPLLHMMLNCVFGGKGVGLMNMIMYVMLAVFLCGLMIGRTRVPGQEGGGPRDEDGRAGPHHPPPADPGLLQAWPSAPRPAAPVSPTPASTA